KKAFGAMGRIAPDLLVQDATVPRTRLPEVLAGIAEIGRRFDLQIANVFHAGDGNLHPNIMFDRLDAEELARVEKASKEIMALCVDAGGTITGEHGVGVDKRQYMHLVHGAAELARMAAMKSAFDPRGLFNPGKVLPEVDAAGQASGAVPAMAGPRAGLGAVPGARSGRASGEAVVRPASVDEIPALLAQAADAGRQVVPIGTGRHRVRPIDPETELAVSVDRLAGIEIYEPADLTLTAGAGTTVRELIEAMAPHDQWLPFDPPDFEGRTLGGLVAAGLSGPLASGYGALRNHVLGATVVCGDGQVVRLGGRVVKNVAGFDLLRPVIGSRGSLGVITSVCVRLFPVPQVDRLLVARADTPAALMEAARAVACAPVVPASTVLSVGVPGLEGVAALVVRLHGSRATVDADQTLIERAAGREFEAHEGVDARRLTLALRDHPGSPGIGRVAVFPAHLGDAVEALSSALGEVPFVADVHEGRIRFGFDAGAVPGLARLRGAESGGGSLGFESAPSEATMLELEAVRTGPSRAEAALAERVRAVYDPNGVFASVVVAETAHGGAA
ncbi:MAG TPA: FAD-linked oxidase C-terminal domain-containing protein, partial [Acidimicrobiia bacterium]|nr:FAD-linked oxidase C-terminal domain-containing protein [Acidimicrobiia bacterium]